MKEKRKFQRFPVQFNAVYTFVECPHINKCTITDISREGTHITIHTQEKIDPGSRLNLEINIPGCSRSIKCIITIQWIEKQKKKTALDFNCGGHFEVIPHEDKWILLDYAFERWKKNGGHTFSTEC
ncbi:MAG: PilZ domain-containing protein [Pseudomonadota bacterium]